MKRLLDVIRIAFAGGVALLYLVGLAVQLWERAHGRSFEFPIDTFVLLAVVGFLFGPEIVERAKGWRSK